MHARLGRMTVPLRHAHPESGSVELAFVRLRSGEPKSVAPFVYLAGGPGASGVNAALNPRALPLLARLAKTADVILPSVSSAIGGCGGDQAPGALNLKGSFVVNPELCSPHLPRHWRGSTV